MMEKYQAIFKILVVLIFVMIILKICLIFLWPFLIAIILSFLLEPLIKFFLSIGIPRKFGVWISLFFTAAVVIITGFCISNSMYSHINSFWGNFSSILSVLGKKFGFINIESFNYVSLIKTLESFIISYREKIFSTIITTVNGFLYTITIIMTTLFLSLDFENIVNLIKRNVSSDTYWILHNISFKIEKIIRVEIQLILITTIQTVIGFYILGINNSLTIGIICGILDLLPVVGPTLIFVPLIIYEFAISNIFTGTGLILLFILLQVSREVMKIKFVGYNLKIHPLATVISLYLGVIFYGLWGVILGPLIVILITELFDLFYEGSRSKGI